MAMQFYRKVELLLLVLLLSLAHSLRTRLRVRVKSTSKKRPGRRSSCLPLAAALLPIRGKAVNHVPFDRAAVVEMHAPDRSALIGLGDAASDGADPQRAAAETPRPILIAFQLFQLHPITRPVWWYPGDLLSALKRRFLANCRVPPLR